MPEYDVSERQGDAKAKGRITTQEELETLLTSPAELDSYVERVVQDEMGDVNGLIKDAVADGVKAARVKRPGMFDPNEPNPEAVGADMDGKFGSMGEFLRTIHHSPRIGDHNDKRLKILGESEGDAGGFLVPEEFRTTLMTLALEEAIVRPRAFTMPMASDRLRIPAIRDTTHASNVFGGVSVNWTPESGTISASEPTFSQIALTAKKLTGHTISSNELLADSAVGLSALLTQLFGQAIRYFEDDAFIAGDGAGEPVGFNNSNNPALVSVAKETGQAADTIVWENLVNMYARMLPSSLGRAVWIANPDTFPQLATLQLSVGTGGSAIWINNGQAGPPASILGRPLVFSEKMNTVGDAGDIMFADLSYYAIGDRQSVTVASSPHVRFTTDETVWRFIERLDGRPWLDSPLTPRRGTNTLSPFVRIAARA